MAEATLKEGCPMPRNTLAEDMRGSRCKHWRAHCRQSHGLATAEADGAVFGELSERKEKVPAEQKICVQLPAAAQFGLQRAWQEPTASGHSSSVPCGSCGEQCSWRR